MPLHLPLVLQYLRQHLTRDKVSPASALAEHSAERLITLEMFKRDRKLGTQGLDNSVIFKGLGYVSAQKTGLMLHGASTENGEGVFEPWNITGAAA